jgi:hypothetical protein
VIIGCENFPSTIWIVSPFGFLLKYPKRSTWSFAFLQPSIYSSSWGTSSLTGLALCARLDSLFPPHELDFQGPDNRLSKHSLLHGGSGVSRIFPWVTGRMESLRTLLNAQKGYSLRDVIILPQHTLSQECQEVSHISLRIHNVLDLKFWIYPPLISAKKGESWI